MSSSILWWKSTRLTLLSLSLLVCRRSKDLSPFVESQVFGPCHSFVERSIPQRISGNDPPLVQHLVLASAPNHPTPDLRLSTTRCFARLPPSCRSRNDTPALFTTPLLCFHPRCCSCYSPNGRYHLEASRVLQVVRGVSISQGQQLVRDWVPLRGTGCTARN